MTRRSPSNRIRRPASAGDLGQRDRGRHGGVEALDPLASAGNPYERVTFGPRALAQALALGADHEHRLAVELGLTERVLAALVKPVHPESVLAQDVEAPREVRDPEHIDELGT